MFFKYIANRPKRLEFSLHLHPDGTDNLYCQECGTTFSPAENFQYHLGQSCSCCVPEEFKGRNFAPINLGKHKLYPGDTLKLNFSITI
jgi:hypothetical protein